MEFHGFLNSLDAIVIGVVLFSAFLAFMRGFVREFFSLIAWIGAYFIGTTFYEPVVPWMQNYIKSERLAEWAAVAFVFLIALILLSVLGYVVCGFVRGQMATKINRWLGFVYGLVRGALVVCLIYLGAVLIFWPNIDSPPLFESEDEAPPEVLMKASTRPLMAYGAKMLVKLIPEEIVDDPWASLDEGHDSLKRALRDNDFEEMKNNYLGDSDDRDDEDNEKESLSVDEIFTDENVGGPVNIHKLFNQDDDE
ncbi:MAG: CvpA family protein [Alphaproteobacteria bacterium]|nr:CvpA family protein [Alphaproteobacteria bacterium]